MMELLQENGGFTGRIEQDCIHKFIIFGQIDHQHHGIDPWSTEKILVSENESIGYQNDLGQLIKHISTERRQEQIMYKGKSKLDAFWNIL
jgi:hypothetical protein